MNEASTNKNSTINVIGIVNASSGSSFRSRKATNAHAKRMKAAQEKKLKDKEQPQAKAAAIEAQNNLKRNSLITNRSRGKRPSLTESTIVPIKHTTQSDGIIPPTSKRRSLNVELGNKKSTNNRRILQKIRQNPLLATV
jgi:hypothetical protein